jgi:hypothetical protein
MLLTDKEKKEYIWVKRLSNKEGEWLWQKKIYFNYLCH